MLTYSGFVSIIGPPNAGKSTLLNLMLEETLSIVSPFEQTTRNQIHGVLTLPHSQIIFLDTPGILRKTKTNLDKKLELSMNLSTQEVDLILFLLPINLSPEFYEERLSKIIERNIPLILLRTKSDILKPSELPSSPMFQKIPSYEVSLTETETRQTLLQLIQPLIPQHPFYYPTDILSNRNIRFFAQEYIRLSLLTHLKYEIPHLCFVEIAEMIENKSLTTIEATIFTERENHRKIIIGKKGSMLQEIGTYARMTLENYLNKKVMLKIQIKVKKHWRKDENFLKKLEHY